MVKHGSDNVSKNGPKTLDNTLSKKWSGGLCQQLSNKWFGKLSPNFESEFVEMFPVDRLSIFEGFRFIPKHFFDVSEQMFDWLCLRNFSRWSLSSNHVSHSSHLGSMLADLSFSCFEVSPHCCICCMLFVYFKVYVAPSKTVWMRVFRS